MASDAYKSRSVLTIAFQFTFESHLREDVAAMARHYVRTVVGSVQRVAMAIAPSRISAHLSPKVSPSSPEALTLVRWITRSYRFVLTLCFNLYVDIYVWNISITL